MNMLVSLVPRYYGYCRIRSFAIGTEHGESIKSFIAGDLPDITAIQVGHVHIEWESLLYSWLLQKRKCLPSG